MGSIVPVPEPFLILTVLGFIVGVFGTLVGAGGGFLLTPVLLVVYPHDSPATITAISLAVVFFNAASGSLAYGWQRRIDFRSGLAFAVATLPGAIAGALLVTVAPRRIFDPLMAVLLGVLAIWLLVAGGRPEVQGHRLSGSPRTITDRSGNTYRYSVRVGRGVALSVGVGFLSSFLGIGGGIIHVPLLVQALGFPVHIATATSHFVLSIMSSVGSLTHILSGDFQHGGRRVVPLAIGVVIGAQVGAALSQRTKGHVIQRLLAFALLGLSIRLAIGSL